MGLCPWTEPLVSAVPLVMFFFIPLSSPFSPKPGARKRKLPGWKAVVVVSGWDCKCIEVGGWSLG